MLNVKFSYYNRSNYSLSHWERGGLTLLSLIKSRAFITTVTIILILIALYFLLPISLPLVTAFLTAFILAPLVNLITKNLKIKRHFSIMIVFTLFVCFIGLGSYFLVTKAITQTVYFIEHLPTYITEVNFAWQKFQKDLEYTYEDLPPELVYEINNQVTQALNNLRLEISTRNWIGDITSLVSKIPNYFVTFVVYLIALFLFLLELPRLKSLLYSYMTEKTIGKVTFMISRLNHVFFGFFKAQFFVSVIIFIASLIGLLIIAPDVALLMSFIIWIIDLIPIIGSIVILAPWALFQLFTGNITLGTQLLILAAVLLIIRRTVEPKVMGQHIGLSPLATLIAIYLGLMLFGVVGFFIGPLIVILFTSAREAGIIKINFKI